LGGLDGATGPDYTDIGGAVLVGVGRDATTASRPQWPIDATSAPLPDLASAPLAFAGGYMNQRTVVVQPYGAGIVTLGSYRGVPFQVPITHLTIAMNVPEDGSAAADGVLSGIIPTSEVVALVHQLARGIGGDPALFCDESGVESFAEQVVQASDILVDGTQDPNRTCDGISIGLGFEAVRVALGPSVPTAEVPDKCSTPDGG
jgi:hypothetical protein